MVETANSSSLLDACERGGGNHDPMEREDARMEQEAHTNQRLTLISQQVVLERAWQKLIEKDFLDLRRCI